MTHWKEILQDSLTKPADLARHFDFDYTVSDDACASFPMRINRYYFQLIKEVDDPIWKQTVPNKLELEDKICIPDPLGEETLSPVPGIVHKYPDRVLLFVASKCAMYCRFCTRKRMVGSDAMCVTEQSIETGIDYIRRNSTIREVLLSGGDPLLLSDTILDSILGRLHAIPHLEVIRIGSRIPCTLPMRITENLANVLGKYHPLYINTHFNHPRELTKEAAKACERLADTGIPLGCQTVLLKGINDNVQILRKLFTGLLKIRVKPYYLFQGDLSLGTNHFRTHSSCGINIMKQLIGTISGMAVPTLALDAPGGKGKIPLTPDYIISSGKELVFRNYQGEICSYPENGSPAFK
ncbi:MAG: lysine 2,3-aminomutase [Desulfocapsa sp.]|nr:MAG: lysine 2,3-aminomutase [Desulfocapsa sp.]